MTKILGNSIPVIRLRERIARVAPSDARVLVLGENGTGKDLVAEALHLQSKRRDAPFVAINCAAVPESLIESELFGHEKGAFTGATDRRIGRFEQADTGTLFLDEVGEMPLGMQSKLLRVLQGGTFERIGGKSTLRVDVRVIAATNKDLRAEVRAHRFREDLYHRLAVIPIQTPPLRERMDDVPVIAEALLARSPRPTLKLSDPARRVLMLHRYPGNVRELVNVIERLVVMAQSEEVSAADVREALDMDLEYSREEPAEESELDRLTKQVSALTDVVAIRGAMPTPLTAPSSPPETTPEPVVEAAPEPEPTPRELIPGARVVLPDGREGIVDEMVDEMVSVYLLDENGLPKMSDRGWRQTETWSRDEALQGLQIQP